jgi:hypothetical protein
MSIYYITTSKQVLRKIKRLTPSKSACIDASIGANNRAQISETLISFFSSCALFIFLVLCREIPSISVVAKYT